MSEDPEEALRRFDEWERGFVLPDLPYPPPPSGSRFLRDWLAERERAFPAWAASHGPADRWDFSPDSIDALATVVREETPTEELFRSPERAEFAEGAAWYWGEVLRRARPSRWEYTPGEPDEHSPFLGHFWVQRLDVKASYTPLLNLVRMLRLEDHRLLGELFREWMSW
ncbi:hypothetical protein FNH05_23075 [Amycolatopsis rhizosphaerae]|uniref:Uncharacterized protein n=1 Tax=Amycolatopsis rhizosphaerae TaxID=2053003 RepID=A0A558BWZ4_9PSEU|nr:hypothetical protein [Amycolatopsis rhizosphaerae]TVT41038.1 hypothetical protein FNH05_23075 [Amycolatopsis rhizosphaerae]